ncbi:MAG: hypothetical protein HYV09_06805 [Deltaproteobacteria bacterium]|nr:hypothetical protein [Deltaproteobacteria bacterium]
MHADDVANAAARERRLGYIGRINTPRTATTAANEGGIDLLSIMPASAAATLDDDVDEVMEDVRMSTTRAKPTAKRTPRRGEEQIGSDPWHLASIEIDGGDLASRKARVAASELGDHLAAQQKRTVTGLGAIEVGLTEMRKWREAHSKLVAPIVAAAREAAEANRPVPDDGKPRGYTRLLGGETAATSVESTTAPAPAPACKVDDLDAGNLDDEDDDFVPPDVDASFPVREAPKG